MESKLPAMFRDIDTSQKTNVLDFYLGKKRFGARDVDAVIQELERDAGLSCTGCWTDRNISVMQLLFPTTDGTMSGVQPLDAATAHSFTSNSIIMDRFRRVLRATIDYYGLSSQHLQYGWCATKAQRNTVSRLVKCLYELGMYSEMVALQDKLMDVCNDCGGVIEADVYRQWFDYVNPSTRRKRRIEFT